MSDVSKIQEILNKPQIPHLRFSFGRYEGELLEKVIKTERGYQWLLWAMSEESVLTSIQRSKIKQALELSKRPNGNTPWVNSSGSYL